MQRSWQGDRNGATITWSYRSRTSSARIGGQIAHREEREQLGPWTRATRDPVFLERFASAYTGSHAPLDALWWLENPDRPTPEGLTSPHDTVQHLRAAMYRADATSDAASHFRAASEALDDDADRARKALQVARAGRSSPIRRWRRSLVPAVIGTIAAAGLFSFAATSTRDARSDEPTAAVRSSSSSSGTSRSPSFSIPNVYAHYHVRPPGQLLLVSTQTAPTSAVDLPLHVPEHAGYFTIIWRCDPNSKITWRLTRGVRTIQGIDKTSCTSDLRTVIRARVGRPDPTALQVRLDRGVHYSFAIYAD